MLPIALLGGCVFHHGDDRDRAPAENGDYHAPPPAGDSQRPQAQPAPGQGDYYNDRSH
jgi:hypothetical protein